MKIRIFASLALVLGIGVIVSCGASTAQSRKPKVMIIATGGTIAGSATSNTSAGYQSGAVGVDVLINAVPQMKEIADVSGEQISSIGSQDMCDSIWLKLGKRVNEVLARPDMNGVVITHGTDTMEETSYFLDLVVHSDKPVVLTGSMRPSTAMSADGPLNIYNAVAIAADPLAKGRGVMVTVDDDIHSAHDIVKTHSTDVGTMSSGEVGLLGAALFGKNTWFRSPNNVHTTKSEFNISNVNALPRVDIIYAHANMSPDIITSAVANGAKGLVIAGVGDGNMTAPAAAAAKAAAAKGVVVVRSSRTNGGIIRRNIELNDDDMGTVTSMELNPAKARVLLQLALLKTSDPKTIQGYFDRY
ncbi:MAG TPA: type II asparaginase [Candidatus Eisenbacteria bacterium]|jgi:L-asparaginase|nr:type II asparaginase [Candidatus Eisenbacteria bacterium]